MNRCRPNHRHLYLDAVMDWLGKRHLFVLFAIHWYQVSMNNCHQYHPHPDPAIVLDCLGMHRRAHSPSAWLMRQIQNNVHRQNHRHPYHTTGLDHRAKHLHIRCLVRKRANLRQRPTTYLHLNLDIRLGQLMKCPKLLGNHHHLHQVHCCHQNHRHLYRSIAKNSAGMHHLHR